MMSAHPPRAAASLPCPTASPPRCPMPTKQAACLVPLPADAQQVLAECFLSTLQKYLKGLMADLRAYTITDVSPSLERTRRAGAAAAVAVCGGVCGGGLCVCGGVCVLVCVRGGGAGLGGVAAYVCVFWCGVGWWCAHYGAPVAAWLCQADRPVPWREQSPAASSRCSAPVSGPPLLPPPPPPPLPLQRAAQGQLRGQLPLAGPPLHAPVLRDADVCCLHRWRAVREARCALACCESRRAPQAQGGSRICSTLHAWCGTGDARRRLRQPSRSPPCSPVLQTLGTAGASLDFRRPSSLQN